ncbi:MAG: response regulator transcription factor [Saprospiraceae bacterium]
MNIKVGIVDDHQLIIDGIKSILSSEIDIEVVIQANEGIEFLAKIKHQKVDVVLTDIRMHRMDGIALTKNLLSLYPKLPILVISMFDQPADIREVAKAGAKGHIPKNVNRKELIKAIRSVYNGYNYFPFNYDDVISKEPNKSTKLTKRESQIVALIANGRTSFEISQELHISKFTVDTHRKNVHKKLAIDNQAGLIKFALEQNFNKKI